MILSGTSGQIADGARRAGVSTECTIKLLRVADHAGGIVEHSLRGEAGGPCPHQN